MGETVWIHPHGSRHDVVAATVESVSSNQRAIAVRLHDKPVWCRIDDGFFVHQEHGQIAMLLYREKFGPWIEIVHQGHYEIEEEEPR